MGGGDKALVPLSGRPLLSHVVARLGPQVEDLALNAVGNPERFEGFGLPVLDDPIAGRPGPLAGIHAAMLWAGGLGGRWVVTVPCDVPFLPEDLVPRLLMASGEGAQPAVAASNGRKHPVVGLWPVDMASDLAALLENGSRKVGAFAGAARVAEFPAHDFDPFLNTNTPEDLARAEALL